METILFLLILFCAFTIQALTGFGGPLITMPVSITLLGVETAKPVIIFASFFVATCVSFTVWRHINWREVIKMALPMLVFMALGMWIFVSADMNFLQIIYGIIVILIGAQKLFLPKLGDPPKPVLYLCLALAGVMQGMFVSGGSFLVVYAVSVLKEKEEFRATMSGLWSVVNLFLLTATVIKGDFNAVNIALAAKTLIPLILAMIVGIAWAKRLNKEMFLRIAYIMLIISGTVLLVSNIV